MYRFPKLLPTERFFVLSDIRWYILVEQQDSDLLDSPTIVHREIDALCDHKGNLG
jgi:hypothetical protein